MLFSFYLAVEEEEAQVETETNVPNDAEDQVVKATRARGRLVPLYYNQKCNIFLSARCKYTHTHMYLYTRNFIRLFF